MWQKLSPATKAVMHRSQTVARILRRERTDVELFLIALLDQAYPDRNWQELDDHQPTLQLRRILDQKMVPQKLGSDVSGGLIPISDQAAKALSFALESAKETHSPLVQPANLLEGVVRVLESAPSPDHELIGAIEVVKLQLIKDLGPEVGEAAKPTPTRTLCDLLDSHYYRVTKSLKDAARAAESAVNATGAPEVLIAHWLIAIFSDRNAGASIIVQEMGCEPDLLIQLLQKALPKPGRSTQERPPFAEEVEELWRLAYAASSHGGVSTEQLLLSLVSLEDDPNARILSSVGVTPTTVGAMMGRRVSPGPDRPKSVPVSPPLLVESSPPTVAHWGADDLTVCMLLAEEDALGSGKLRLSGMEAKSLELRIRASISKNRKLHSSPSEASERNATSLIEAAFQYSRLAEQAFHVGHALMAAYERTDSVTCEVLSSMDLNLEERMVAFGLKAS
jgi:ATP-dependent Clp protease ATP-binding subunit ClpA